MAIRTNLCPNPVPASATGWAGGGGTAVGTMSDGVTPCFEVTSNGVATPYIFSAGAVPAVASGGTYVLSAMIEVVGDVGGTAYTVRGHGVTGNVYFSSGSTTYLAGSGLQRVTIVCVPNANVAAGEFQFSIVRSATGAAGVKVRMGKLLIEQATSFASYFDGTSQFAAWTGAANGSTSTLYVPASVISPFTDANPCPRALVTITDLPPAAVTLTLYRTAAGRQMQVRGGVNLACVGGAAVMDYEVPFGVPVNYQAQLFDVSGNALGFTSAATTTVAVTAVWIHQPLSPTLAISPQVTSDSMQTLVRQTPGELIQVEGATSATWIGGQRGGLSQVPLTILCASTADADEFQSMFGGYSSTFPAVLCIRTPPPYRLPPVFFASCPAPQEIGYMASSTLTFALTLDEVRPPTPGLVIPILRREDIDAAFTTRDARAAAYATRIARDTDYSKAGLAG